MDIVRKSWKVQRRIEEKARRFGRGKYGQVLRMARKPEPEEYIRTLQLVAIGLLLIGFLGFGIYLIMSVLIPDLLGTIMP